MLIFHPTIREGQLRHFAIKWTLFGHPGKKEKN